MFTDADKDPRSLTREESNSILEQRRKPTSDLEQRRWGDLVGGDLIQIARSRRSGVGPEIMAVSDSLGDGTDTFPDLPANTHVVRITSELITRDEWEAGGPQGGLRCIHKDKLVYYHGHTNG